MDRPGTLPGGLVSEIRNSQSQRACVISTALELGQDYWSTAILPVVDTPRLFGLLRRSAVDAANPIHTVIRNTLKDAHHVHAAVKAVVTSEPEDRRDDLLPAVVPPDGWSPGARAKLRETSGDAPGPVYSQDPNIEAAYRILVRNSRDPGAYIHDSRRVLFFACSKVAALVASAANLTAVGEMVGETSDTIAALLESAGYDVDALLAGDNERRILDAMEATVRLFADLAEQNGAETPDTA